MRNVVCHFSAMRALDPRLWLLGLFVTCLTGPSLFAEDVRASHILLRSREEAEQVRAEILKNGGDRAAFIAAAREHSLDATTKVQGGDLNYFSRSSDMDRAFVDAAFSLEVDQISEPVKSQFGWHLIYLRDRRGSPEAAPPTSRATGGQTNPGDAGNTEPGDGDPTELIPIPDPPRPVDTRPVPPAVKATGTRRQLLPKQLVLSIEAARASRFPKGANQFLPENAVELDLVLKNKGSTERKVPDPSLLVLGFELSEQASHDPVRADYSGLQKPENLFVALAPYEILGAEVSINDWFKDLEAIGRYDLSWNARTFFRNLEALWPDAKNTADYEAIKTDLSDTASAITVDQIRRDALPHWRFTRSTPYTFSILPAVKPGDRLYAQMKISGERDPVVIELDSQRQLRAVEHFVALALDGFYDMLTFYDVQSGDYVLAGCPLKRGTGAPAMQLPENISNTAKIPHQRGTVSFVSRSIRTQGPARGGQIGSIFFVSLKPHPEWDDAHVPFGRVVEGLEILERVKPATYIESITILPASEYQGAGASSDSETMTSVESNQEPVAVIKTSKGDLRVVLHEDVARNTVSSFITLAENGFFNGAANGKKMTFFNVMKDQQGNKLLIQTGSPTNDSAGHGEYQLPDESNDKKCVRGALVMSKKWDPEAGAYVADSASTQFFICLQAIPAYDFQGAFTVFGQVDPSSFDVLDKLAEGDEIVGVEVTQKRNHSYATFQKR